MKTFFRAIYIAWLKYRARLALYSITDLKRQYDCGEHMLNTVTGGELNRLTNKFNRIIARLKVVDPNYGKKPQ